MIKIIIVLLFACVSFVQNFAQDCQDTVYLLSKDSIIINCCILEVKYGNIVHFIKGDKRYVKEAHKIIKDGEPFELQPYTTDPQLYDNGFKDSLAINETSLYKGFDYNYYNKKYKSAKAQMAVGIVLTITGAAANLASIFYANDNDTSNDDFGVGINLYGIMAFNTGLPLWISGAIKRGNNRDAMRRTQLSTSNSGILYFGITENGVGFTFNL